MTSSDKVRSARVKKGLTRKDLAKLSGLSEATIRRVEERKTNSRAETLARIAIALEVDHDWLLGKHLEDYTQSTERENETIKSDFSLEDKSSVHELLPHLVTWDFTPYIEQKCRGFFGRDWLFDEVENWRWVAEGEQALLITGDPGVGKSAFAAQLVRTNPESSVIAHHFCHHGSSRTLDP